MGFLPRLGDPGYRLNGENPATTNLDQARRWAATYTKLVEFKRELLELTRSYAENSEPEVACAIQDTDVVMLEAEISRFQQRRDFWQIRQAELAGIKNRATG
jgi:hypothetical protein